MAFTPSPEQAAITSEIVYGSGHLAVDAKAGTGKSTTAVQSCVAYRPVHPSHEVLIVSFGKDIAEENAQKLIDAGLTDRSYSSKTSHSLGNSLCSFFMNRPNIDEQKVFNLVNTRAEAIRVEAVRIHNSGKPGDAEQLNADARQLEQFAPFVRKLVALAKREGFGFFNDCQIDDKAAWYRLVEHYGIDDFEDTSDLEIAVAHAQAVYRASLDQTDVIDFDDMVLFPLVKNLRTKFQKDLIIVDEYQDISRARDALIKRHLKPGGKMVIVGDPNQAIMGFTGASSTAMEDGIAALSAKVLPLSVTYRCPKAVVALAQGYVPGYSAHENNADGEVIHTQYLPDDLQPGDALLCRNTQPLVETAYELIRAGKGCKVQGRDVAAGLKALARRWKVKTTTELLRRLETYEAKEIQKAQARGDETKVERIQDTCGTLRVVIHAVNERKQQSVDDVVAYLDALFVPAKDEAGGEKQLTNVILLCTYHRAKGREWDRVVLIEHATRCPSRAARKPWQISQEKNLAYVAITRAKKTLVITSTKEFKPT